MVTQTLPDQFYHLMFMAGVLLALTGRVWHLMLHFVRASRFQRHDAQWKRYCIALLGLGSSFVIVVVLLTQYSLHGVITGLNEMYSVSPFMGVVMWATFVVHLVTIPAMIGFIVWFYCHPIKRLRGIV